jgi:hypothetical protein
MATSLYSVFDGLTPTAEQIVEAELLAVQILQAQYPNLDLRLGTGLRDMVVRPSAMLLALVKIGLDFYFSENTIEGVDDTTPTDVVDSILSNWFITRNLGTRAVISARLYFARRKNTAITSDVFFSPDNVSLFYPATSATYASTAMTYDSFSNEYYIDVSLTAQNEGSQYNIGSGSLLYFSNFDPYFLHAEINYLVSASVSSETNEQFISRTNTAISTRNLINDPSISSNLLATFNYLTQIVSIGMGDPEMVRDQIQAVFTGQLPQVITQLSSVGTTATAVLADHGYNSGQTVVIAGGAPTTYNGSFIITVIDESTFSYQMATSSGSVTVLPTVQAVNAPLLIHNGGMVDVYCGNTLANSIIQVTTDQFGNAELTGAIYEFIRSSVTGGTSADTIPINATIVASSTTVNTGSMLLQVASVSHGLRTGQIVTLSGLSQTLNISTISCSGISVTVVSTAHGLTSGMSVVVQNVTPSTYNGTYTIIVIDANTFTYIVSFNIATAGAPATIGTPMSVANPTLSGNFPVTVLNANSFTIPLAGLWVNGITINSAVVTYPVQYTTLISNLQEQAIQQITCAGTTVTVTIANHGITANRYVTISGVSPSTYNGVWLVSNDLSKDQFQYVVPANIVSSGVNGICTSVIPSYDYGFSSRQILEVGFGSQYANSTASFQISYFDNVDSVQTYLENSTNRVLCADLLARGFNFYSLDVTVTGYNVTAPDSSAVTTAVQAYLATLSPGDIFIMADLNTKMSTAGITGIKTPIGVTYTQYTRDLIPPNTGTIVDYLDPNDRTNIFILNTVTTATANI